MKKKKWRILCGILAGIFLVAAIGIGVMLGSGVGFSTGRYLEASGGDALVIIQNSPIEMHNQTDKDLFENLDTGDEILVLHGVIAESYPGQTWVYAVFKLGDGTIADIPQNVIEQLTELGWWESGIVE